MNICFITQHYFPEKSGNASRVYDMSTQFSKSGVNCTVIAPFPSFPFGHFSRSFKPFSNTKINPNLNLINLFTYQPGSNSLNIIQRMLYSLTFCILTFLWLLKNSSRYDKIIISTPPIFLIITFLLPIFDKNKLIIEVRDLWVEASISLGFVGKNSLIHKIMIYVNYWGYKSAQHIVVTSNLIKKYIIDCYGINENIIHLVPNGLNDIFLSNTSDEETLYDFIYAGNIGPAQDFELLIQIIQNLNDLGLKNLNICIIGGGEELPKLKQLAFTISEHNNFEFHAPITQNKLISFYSKSKIGIALLKSDKSLFYAIPTKLYEYHGMGIPSLGSGSKEVEQFLNKSKGGIFINPKQYDIENVHRLLTNQIYYDKYSDNSKKYVSINFNRETIAKKYLEILSKVPN